MLGWGLTAGTSAVVTEGGPPRPTRIILRKFQSVGLAALAAIVVLLSALSASSVRAGEYDFLEPEHRKLIQHWLVWTGHYDGMIDGAIGPRSMEAIRDFQSALGQSRTGILTERQVQVLRERSDWEFGRADFQTSNDPDVGLFFGFPYAFMKWRDDNEMGGNTYADEPGRFRLNTFVFENVRPEALDALSRNVFADLPGFERNYRRAESDWAVVVGEDRTEFFYMRALRTGDEIRGLWIWYDKALNDTHSRYITAIANSMSVGERQAKEPQVASRSSGPDRVQASADPTPTPSTGTVLRGTGTAFIVRGDGKFVTNAHVIDGCGRVTVGGFGNATVERVDDDRDIALLSVDGIYGLSFAPLANDDALLGEDVFAFGYPLSDVLGTELGFSRGSVSAMMGLDGDQGSFRMTAQVQPGNSGGPLLDAEGRLVGIVTAKLNAIAVADRTGDIPQAMNFAIKVGELRNFLERAGIEIVSIARGAGIVRPVELAKRARGFTYHVSCFE